MDHRLSMRIIDRYIAGHMLGTFGISLATLSFVILIHRIMLLVDLIVTKGAGVGEVLRLFLHSLPLALVISIPFSALLAGIAVYGRMTVDNESVALKTAGVSPLRLQLPALAFGVPGCLLTLFISLELLPFSARAFRDLVFQMTREKALASLQEGTFNNEFEGLSLYFKRLAPDGALQEIMLEDHRDPAERRLVLAREGRVTFDAEDLQMSLRLREGSIHMTQPDLPSRLRFLSFVTYDMRFDVGGRLGAVAARGRDRKELTVNELVRDARRQRAQGASDVKWWVEIHRRLAIPVSCLLFPLIGSALGLRVHRAGRMTSIVLGLGIGLGYYALLAGGEDLGTRERLAPLWAMWLPNAALAVAGAWLLLLGAREGLRLPLFRLKRWETGRLGRQATGAPGA